MNKNSTSSGIGLTRKESQKYSLVRVIRALSDPTDRRAQEAAAFELECSRAAEDDLGRPAQGLRVPTDVLTRDFIAGPGGTGQYLVGTDNPGGSFIDVLTNRLMVRQMGATIMPGLRGDVAIPKMTSGSTMYWVAESGAPSESQPVLGQVTASPKTAGAYTDISRKLLLQSLPNAEGLVQGDLVRTVSTGVDLAALHGSGSDNQPQGLVGTAGVDSVAGGDNGLAPAYSHLVALESGVAASNADAGSLGYLVNSATRAKLKRTFINETGGDTPLWTSGNYGPGFGELNGYRAGVSNQVRSDLTKGSGTDLSAIFYGNWADLVLCMWGGLDLIVDPYTHGSSGTVRVVCLTDVDVLVRRPESFSVMVDAITT